MTLIQRGVDKKLILCALVFATIYNAAIHCHILTVSVHVQGLAKDRQTLHTSKLNKP